MAAITIAVAREGRADNFVVNDLNPPLVELLRAAVESPEELLANYETLWKEQFDFPEGHIAHYYKVRDEFNCGITSPEHMLYLLARCVKGSVRYGRNGCFNQSLDKRRHGTAPKTLANNIRAISMFLNGKASFFSKDYREILESAHEGDIVYMDPPYQGVSNVRDNRYYSGIDFSDFATAIEDLNRRGIDFLISYDGMCGDKLYGEDLPSSLGLQKVLLNAGLSSQNLLLGKKAITFEALYVSPRLQREIQVAKPQTQTFAFYEDIAV